MIRRLLIVLVVLLIANDNAFAELNRKLLGPGDVLQGHFVQEQHRYGYTTVLRSEGSFVLVTDRGLLWRTARPVDTTVVITTVALLQLAAGKEVGRILISRAPAIAHFYEMLESALEGDFTALKQEFSVVDKTEGQKWELILSPLKNDELAAAQIQQITITGSAFVDTVVIQRGNGDTQRLIFSQQALSSGPLSSEDAGLLADANQ